ncbi:hypothetical protein ACHAXA_003063, partial [Cyclostephanos tholiformis]
ITIRDGNFTNIDGLDPTITWQNSALLSNDVALQYGIDLSARTTNLASLPRRVWGRASRVFLDRGTTTPAIASRSTRGTTSIEIGGTSSSRTTPTTPSYALRRPVTIRSLPYPKN